ncbi:hypothetical protein HA402_012517 [Bradysia odoriphaga]|nr:hypothetical protein HA402_012517 [Bradysia odoriphaga]
MYVKIASVMAISSGISVTVAVTFTYDMTTYGIDTVAMLWLVIGIIWLIVALFGMFTAFKESTAFANTYGILIMVVFIWQIGVSIYSFSFLNQTHYIVTHQLKRTMIDYSYGYQVEVDWIQSNFQCCGINGPSDWQNFGRFSTPYPHFDRYDYLNSTTDAPLNETDLMPVSCCEQYSNYVDLKCDQIVSAGVVHSG